ncbi:hypothetical protein BDC45DRAFT_536536 [Circinella umbellata]|nr:hypothetical protein BDC45DRAFT_536536 [Circinella umbellata]
MKMIMTAVISKKNKNNNCPIVPYSNFLYGSTLEYLENEQACLEKWSKLGPVYRVYLFGRQSRKKVYNWVGELDRTPDAFFYTICQSIIFIVVNQNNFIIINIKKNLRINF